VAEYPAEAYASNGELWWELVRFPGSTRRFGGEPKLAAYLQFNCVPGEVLTLRQLRQAIADPDGAPNSQEHFNRRLRELRKFRWGIISNAEDGSLGPGEYRFTGYGDPIWLGKAQYSAPAISAKLRRLVFDRDGNRCVLCGVGAGEPYPGEAMARARMTVGHFRADRLRGEASIENLRTECSRCNEPLRDEASTTATADDYWTRLVRLSRSDKQRLAEWLDTGTKTRTEVERIYDEIRVLPAGLRDELRNRLDRAI